MQRRTPSGGEAVPTRARAEALEGRLLLAATLVHDLAPPSGGTDPVPRVEVNGRVFLTTAANAPNVTLRSTDGTAAGARDHGVVESPRDFTAAAGKVFFIGQAAGGAAQVWRSDGQGPAQGVTSFPAAADPAGLAAVGDRLFFALTDADGGRELWSLDAASPSPLPVRVKDVNPGPGHSDPADLLNVNGTLYFSAATDSDGRELWKSDGTDAGTVLVAGIRPGSGSSSPAKLINASGVVFFEADDGASGPELWRSDGTAGGTARVADLLPGPEGSRPGDMLAVGSTLYFTALKADGARSLYKTDGTAGGTALVKDVAPTPGAGGRSALAALGNKVLFAAPAGQSVGTELWLSDGTPEGTEVLKDIRPGPGDSAPRDITVVGGVAYFSAHDGTHGRELWKTDGTAAGTVLVRDINDEPDPAAGSDPASLFAFGARVLFSADDGHTGRELWQSDGTAAGTTLLHDFLPGAGGAAAQGWVAGPDRIFFNASGGATGGLWTSDGTTEGTHFVARTQPSREDPGAAVIIDKVLYYNGDGELWRSDGTPAGTRLVKEFHPSPVLFGDPRWLTDVNGTLFFSAQTTTGDLELWRSDGTTERTVRVKDIVPGTEGSQPSNLVNVNGTLFFTTVAGGRLFKSDGTAAGTIEIARFDEPDDLANAGGRLFFTARGAANDYELYTSDGTAAGTGRLKDIIPGAVGGMYGTVAGIAHNGLYLFNSRSATDYFNASDLWASDGTEAGTVMLKAGAGLPVEVNGRVYFTAAAGRELWTTDGTPQNTALVHSFPPASGRRIFDLAGAGRVGFFKRGEDATGEELWRTDFTPGGAVLDTKFLPDTPDTRLSLLIPVGGKVFFTASGRPLWKADTGETPPLVDVAPVVPARRMSAVGQMTIRFTAPVTGFSLQDLSLSRDGGPNLLTAAQTLTSADNVTWTLGNLGALTDAPGRYSLTLADVGVRIRDGSGLALPPGPFGGAGESFVVDRTAPAPAALPPAGGAAFDHTGGVYRVRFAFSEDVASSLSGADLVLVNRATGAALDLSEAGLTVSYDFQNDVATFSIPATALPNGNYRATVATAGVSDAAGNALVGVTAPVDFFALAGDVNRDRFVNGTDFAILAGNFGRTGRTYAQGDLNGDGVVNGSDFAILAANFGKSVPDVQVQPALAVRPAAPAPVPVPAGSKVARRTVGPSATPPKGTARAPAPRRHVLLVGDRAVKGR
jgi:ELWxxDGT repeat protein